MMKYCLYDFFEEGTVEIESTSFIDLEVDPEAVKAEDFNNDRWNFEREVLVNWPSSSKTKQNKAYVARVKFFADNRLDDELLRVRDEMVSDENESTSVKKDPKLAKGAKRSQKKPLRYESADDEVLQVDMPAANKRKKTKTQAKTNQVREAVLLDRLAKKKETASKSPTDKERIAELQDQVQSTTKERDSLVAALACIKELPALLQEMKNIKQNVRQSSNSPTSSNSSPSPSSKLITHCDPVSPKYDSKKARKSATNNASKYLQDLMTRTFTRQEMASHSLTGGASNANAGQEARPQINKQKMEELFKNVAAQYPDTDMKTLKEAARNKLSNERKLLKKQSLTK